MNKINTLLIIDVLVIIISLIGTSFAFYSNNQNSNQDNQTEFFNSIQEAENLEIIEEGSSKIDGCTFTFKDVHRKKGNKEYALESSNLLKSENCNTNLEPIYFETYRLDKNIYSRQYPDREFTDLTTNPKSVITALTTEEYLNSLFYGGKQLTLDKISDSEIIYKLDDPTEKISGTLTLVKNQSGSSHNIKLKLKEIIEDSESLTESNVIINNTVEDIIFEKDSTVSLNKEILDILDYPEAEPVIYTENHTIQVIDNNSQQGSIHTLLTTGVDKYEAADCYLDIEVCKQKQTLFFNSLKGLSDLLENHQSEVCKETNIPIGKHSEIYKDKFYLNIQNPTRNPSDSFDFSVKLLIDLSATNEDTVDYEVRLQKGALSCFKGKTNRTIITDYISNIKSLIEDIAVVSKS